MSTRVLQQSRALRDSVVHAHDLALRSGDADRIFNRLMATSRGQANILQQWFDGAYDPRQTQHYLQTMARSQIQGATDATASASQASNFGTREFAKQNPNRIWTLTWRHFPSSRPRLVHVHADGTRIYVGENFGIAPGMGAPHCNCLAEVGEEARCVV